MRYTWTKWTSILPPLEVDLVGSWNDPPEKEGSMHQEGQRCKRGCCFWNNACGNLIPPIWWRLAQTENEHL